MNVRVLPVMWLLMLSQGCTPTLTPVFARQATPLTAQSNSPRVLWLLDNSGSMYMPTDPTAPGCLPGCGNPGQQCPPTCPTRQTALQEGLGLFQAALSPSTTHALVVYPSDPLCGPPTSFEVLDQPFPQVTARVAALSPQGGTPTAGALQFAAGIAPLAQAETFVVLVTDGLPNCNAENPHHACSLPDGSDGGVADAAAVAEQLQACRCTASTCSNQLCSLGCLDELGTVAASHRLVEQEMPLMVIGLGADLGSGVARAALSSMEIALGPDCTSAVDCGGSSCGADGHCTEKLFLAPTGPDFARAASTLAAALERSVRCTWWLPRQVTASALEVELGGVLVSPEDWTLQGGAEQRVVITGAPCDRLLAGEESPSISWLPPAE
ncbi:MAG: VWA domain-containing protein [Archangium sp.]|nr:VWA domain-containing protein [Archangium sp.]